MELFSKRMCRVCMTEVRENGMLHFIYKTVTDNEASTIAEILLNTIPRIHITDNDKLPKSICPQCLETLLKMADFQKMCLHSERELSARITSTQTSTPQILTESILALEASQKPQIMYYDEDAQQEKDCVIKEEPHEVIDLTSDDEDPDTQNQREHIITHFEEQWSKDKKVSNIQTEGWFFKSIKNICSPQLVDKNEFFTFKSDELSIIDGIEELQTTNFNRNHIKSEKISPPWGDQEHFLDKIADNSKWDVLVENTDIEESSTMDFLEDHKPKKDSRSSIYVCELCDKKFKKQWCLLTHKRQLHPNDNSTERYECPVCPKVFVKYANFYQHKKSHTGSKKFACDVCDSSFAFAGNLKTHKRMHSVEKPFKCTHCDKSYKYPDNVKKHERSHTGEAAYKCKYCLETFRHYTQLKAHLQRFMGKNVYRCELCPRRFPFARETRLHFLSHKNEEKATRLKNLTALKNDEAKLMRKHKIAIKYL